MNFSDFGRHFAGMTARRINLVVVRAELDYRNSLKSNDQFIVCSNIRRISKLRFEVFSDGRAFSQASLLRKRFA